MTQKVTLPDGREIKNGAVISFGENKSGQKILYSVRITDEKYQALVKGQWGSPMDDRQFDNKADFIEWCTSEVGGEVVEIKN